MLIPSGIVSVGLCPDHTLLARFAGKDAGTRFTVFEWDTADRDAHLVVDSLLNILISTEMSPGKSCVRRRRLSGRRGEVFAEGVLGVDFAGVVFLEGERPVVHPLLHFLENVVDTCDECGAIHVLLVLMPLVTAGHEYAV